MESIAKQHEMEYSAAPDIIVEVPQPVTLLGAFSDLVKGHSLMCTIPDGISISCSMRTDNSVKVLNTIKQDKKKFIVNNIKYRKEDKWANAVKAIMSAFQATGVKLTGLDILIAGAPTEGYEYNAMIFAGIAKIINDLFLLSLPDKELLSLCRRASMFAPGFKAKDRDLIAIFESKENNVLFFDISRKSRESLALSLDLLSAYILDPAIPYSVLKPLLDEFSVDIIPVFQALAAAFPGEDIKALSEKELRLYCNRLPEVDRHSIEYVLEESNLAKKGYELLKAKDYAGFGKLLSAQQRNLQNKAELTSPETDWLVKRALESPDVLGIAQISLGRPGTMLTLIASNSEVSYTERLEEYDRIFGFHASLRSFIPYGSIKVLNEYSTCK